jgi:hypothetical protein
MKNKKGHRHIEICSKQWILKKNPRTLGAEFSTRGHSGHGVITIGTQWKDKAHQVNMLIHEILEAILVEDYKRYKDSSPHGVNDRYLFVFDHDYLDGLGPKIGAALRSAGVLKDEEF